MKKPSPEAKALSLFLMAFKKSDPACKEKAKRINKQWDLVKVGELSNSAYMEEVQKALTSYGGYSEVIEKTVRFYIDKTGEWNLQGEDKYCLDAKKVAEEILKQK
jgi:hypothetical protein